MATLKSSVTSSRELVSEYESKTAVYLEGESDVAVFQNIWFMDRLNKLKFVKPDGIGCPAVVNEVAQYRMNTGLPAFGIVDRDKLVADKKWDLVWETNDEMFSNAKPYGEYIRVTRRWELENYLILPGAAEDHFAACSKGRVCRSLEAVEDEFLEHAEVLVPHAAMNSARRTHGVKELGDSATSRYSTRVEFEAWLEMNVRNEMLPEIWETYIEHLPKVEAFGIGTTPSERLRTLLRRVNGKALIHRIKSKHGLLDDPTFILAKGIARCGAIPSELAGYLDEFCCV